MKYYIKKASDQDVSRTTVINRSAATHFFNLNFTKRDEEAFVPLIYVPGNAVTRTRIVQKQDIRIFINKFGLEINDLMLFSKNENGDKFLEFIKPTNRRYADYEPQLRNNYLMTDNLEEKPVAELPLEIVTEHEDQTNPMNIPLNTILYGPPGTGKTYSTVEKALEILNQSSSETDVIIKRYDNRKIFRSLLNNRIFFVTMHPSFSYEDFVQGIKPKTMEGTLFFESHNGIFKKVAGIAKDSYIASQIRNDQSLLIDFDLVFSFAFSELIEFDNPVTIPKDGSPFKIIALNDRTLKFETSTGGTGPTYNLSKATIKIIYEKGNNDIILSGNKGYFDAVLTFLNSKKDELKERYLADKPRNINYVLILDEINRANISKVFGELITLLEEDKRIGGNNELNATLPSGEVFGVPPNLFIIGTMNTADKSLALVDIALRRRFQFIPVYPDPEIIDDFGKSEDKADKRDFMISLNERLRKDKGVDFQIGHAYFLKDNTLGEVINQNILPLLTEYYRNDLEKVKKVMQDLGKPVDEEYYTKTGLLNYIAV